MALGLSIGSKCWAAAVSGSEEIQSQSECLQVRIQAGMLDHVHSIRPPSQTHNKELWAPKREKGCCAVDVNTSQLCSERLSLVKGGDGLLGTSQSTFLVVNFTKKEN